MIQNRCPHQMIESGYKLISTSDGLDRHYAFAYMGTLGISQGRGKGTVSWFKIGNDRFPQ